MSDDATKLLSAITELSHEFGGPEFVKGGGGNTSCKTAETLWIKPSGTTLASLAPDRFVAMDRAKLGLLFKLAIPSDPARRESAVKDVMAAAVRPAGAGRPSVESPLHDLLRSRFVVHTHSVLVNGMTCAQDGEAVCRRLFPDALWVPYVDPGFTLCLDAHRRIADYRQQAGRDPAVVVLENHGVFVSGDTPEEIRSRYAHLQDTLAAAYAAAGVPTALRYGTPTLTEESIELAGILQDLLGEDGRAVVSSAPFAVADGPLTPDHIVYSKAFAYQGPLHADALTAFRHEHGYAPRVIATRVGVFGLGAAPKVAQLALELAQDGARVRQLTAAFGGVRYLSVAARVFIENWEVEAYRAQQLSS